MYLLLLDVRWCYGISSNGDTSRLLPFRFSQQGEKGLKLQYKTATTTTTATTTKLTSRSPQSP